MTSNAEDEGATGFLARWSKRKRAEAAGPEGAPPQPEPERDPVPEPGAGEDEAAPFDLARLPDIETLTNASDISGFLQKGVPEALRNAALRKAWTLDPFLRDHIGPAEYAWDFNDPNAMPGFGPLDPATDLQAMLRQVMGEPSVAEPEADAAAGPPAPAESERLPPSARLDDAAGAAPDAPAAAGADAGETQQIAAEPGFEAQTGPVFPRKSRRGGALPV